MTAARPVTYQRIAGDGAARRGLLTTPHGAVETPTFMPVATRSAVKGLDSHDLETVGTRMVLSNTYHLMLRPGTGPIAALGGLHGFMGWEGPILTDSGGYQAFSLSASITEEGCGFRSVYDGSAHFLSPEDAVRIQEELGPDIAMVLDVCLGLPAPRQAVAEGHATHAALGRTVRGRSQQGTIRRCSASSRAAPIPTCATRAPSAPPSSIWTASGSEACRSARTWSTGTRLWKRRWPACRPRRPATSWASGTSKGCWMR